MMFYVFMRWNQWESKQIFSTGEWNELPDEIFEGNPLQPESRNNSKEILAQSREYLRETSKEHGNDSANNPTRELTSFERYSISQSNSEMKPE